MFFSKNLKYLRTKRGLKQSEMAEYAGFKQNQWSGYETGISFPKFKDLIKISDFFKISESDLIHKDLENEFVNKKSNSKLDANQSEIIDTYKKIIDLQDEKIIALEDELKYYKKNENT